VDEDEELTGGDEDLALGLGKLVIVHAVQPDGEVEYETGVLLGMGEAGIRLRVTHRTERVYPELTVGEKTLVKQEVAKLNRAELIMLATKQGWRLAFTKKRAWLVETAESSLMEAAEQNQKPYDTLRPLARTVSTFLPWDTIAKVVSFEEWHEEQQLRPFVGYLNEAEAASKVPEAAETE
jgi:hypothetical protein